jgi:predicted phage baseplate assembly protein
VAGLDGGATSNLFAAAGGANEETLEAARRRAALSLRARERAVTVDDFELLARLAGGVQRARALPLVHPQFPGVKVPGAVTVIVVPPRRDDSVPAIGTLPPLPSDGLLRTVCQALDARRLLTTELFVIAPRYVKLSVRATVQADDDADTAALKEAVELALRRYFDPLLGGDDGLGWPFGGPLRYSKIVQKVFAVKGVDSVPELVLTVDDEEREPCQDVLLADIAPQALVHLAAHAVEVVTARELESTA